MPTTLARFEEVLPEIARKAVCGDDEPRMEPLLDPNGGRESGLLVETSLERVVVTGWGEPTLSLADVSHVRRMMIRVHARRGILCVPLWIVIPNPVMLLATLSKIEIVRLAAGWHDRIE